MIFNDYDMFNNLSQKWKHLKLNNKSLLSKAFILIISSIILQLLGFVFRIEITRHSGTQALAIYQLIMSGYNIIMAFSLQGITLAASRYSAQQFKIKNYDGLCYTKRLSKLWFLILFAIIFIPCLIFKSFVAKNILGDSRTELGLIFILINIFLTGFENINKSIFIGTQKVFHTTVSEISELTIRIISVIFLLNLTKGMKDEISAAVIVFAMIISEISSVIYLSIQYKKIFGKKSNVAKELSKEKLTIIEKKQLKTNFLKTGIPVSFSSLLNKIILSANTILLPQMLMVAGLSREMAMDEFAILFSMTMPLVVLPSCVIMPITTIVMPKISEYCVTDSLDLIKRKSAKMLQIVGMCAIPLFWILLFFANPIFQTIYSSTRGAKYAAILALTTLIEYYQISSASILNGLGHSVRASLSILVEGIIQLVCTITLVPIFKIDGFIIGDILSIVVAATMNVTAVKKHTKIKFKLKNWLLNPLIASVISVLIANLIYISLLNFTIMTFSLILSIISFFIIYFIILRLLGNKLIEYIKKTILISEK